MDVTSTDSALALASTGAPLNPSTLAAVGGALMSHLIQPHLATVSPRLKPIIAVAGPAIVSAVAAIANGVNWKSAVGYGAVTAVSAVANHWAFFKSDGFRAVLAGIAGAIAKK